MQKPAGVYLSAGLLALTSFIGILSTIVLAQLLARQHLSWDTAKVILVSIISFCALGSLYAAWCAAGLFLGKNWARLGSVVFGIFLAIASSCFLVVIVGLWMAPHPHQASDGLHIALVFLGVCGVLLAAFGVWLTVYLSGDSVKQAIVQRYAYVPDSVTYPTPPFTLKLLEGEPAPGHGDTKILSESRSKEEVTVPRILVGIYLVLCIAWSMFALRLAASGKPYFDLGIGLRGHVAAAAYIVWVIADCAIAIGIFRKYLPAYRIALVLQGWCAASLLLWSFPAYRARAHRALASASTPAGSVASQHSMLLTHTLQLAFSVFYGACLVVFTWAIWRDLITIQQAFADSISGKSSDALL